MNLSGKHSSDEFTVEYFSSPFRGEFYINSLRKELLDYEHTINAFGGFRNAVLTVRASFDSIQDWMEDGLGRVIKVYDQDTKLMWEGFANKINVSYSGLEVSIGPLNQIANKVNLVYSSFDTSTNPPTVGVRKITSVAEDTVSQEKYGIWHKLLSAAGVADTQADQLRDLYLSVHAEPDTSSDFASQRNELRLVIECRGFMDYIHYPFNQTTSGTQNLSTKLLAVLAADPNSLFTDTSKIASNTYQVIAYEKNDVRADGLLKGMTALGDSSQNRYLFGIYEDRVPIYRQASSDIDYVIRLSDQGRRVEDDNGGIVYPWQVRPGYWAFFTDFLPGRKFNYDVNLRLDPRALFIEEVVFRLPNTLIVSGSRLSKLDQKLAQMGLAGISA